MKKNHLGLKIEYVQNGDYLIPNIQFEETEEQELNKFGEMRRKYLMEHKYCRLTEMVLTNTLFPHLYEIQEQAWERYELLMKQMADAEGVNETLKATDQLEWVRQMNSIAHQAEEIVLHEMIYI